MTEPRFDLCGIGNAIVDILAQTDDIFLHKENISKGGMSLIDAARAEYLYERMGATIMTSGGSAANTVAGFRNLGGGAAFIGTVFDDQLGAVFAHDLRALGVHYTTPPARHGLPTASCLIFITPDGQRSMNTFLGACTDFGVAHLDETVIADSKMLYMEGYLFDKPDAKAAFYKAAEIAKAHNRSVALTLSDAFCVHRHREAFVEFITQHVDILFANETEACALFEANKVDDVIPLLANICDLAVITLSEQGSIILDKGLPQRISAHPVSHVVDTTGAGDLFAAGFLYGLSQNKPLETCGRMASITAAEVIGHIGPRPQTDLKGLVSAV